MHDNIQRTVSNYVINFLQVHFTLEKPKQPNLLITHESKD